MTTDQIIQCCYIVGLTSGLWAIAYGLYRVSKAMTPRAVPAPGLPPMDPEQVKKQTEQLVAMLRERGANREQDKAQRHGMPPPDLMRPGRYIAPTE